MAALDTFNSNIAKLQADLAAFVAAKQGGASEAQVQAMADQVAAVDASIPVQP